MDALVEHVASAVNSHPNTALVDVANMSQAQLNVFAEYASSHRIVFVSTDKTFNYITETGHRYWLRALKGAHWLVLCSPGSDGYLKHFDGSTFVNTKRERSPVQWNRHGKKCSVHQKGKSPSQRHHYYCEIDDLVLAQSSINMGLEVFTNDRGLQRVIASGTVRVTMDMSSLMSATRTTLLTFDGRAWRRGTFHSQRTRPH